jgi:hypothetical protein
MLESNVKQYYRQHDCSRIAQGDILRDLKFVITGRDDAQIEVFFPYVIVLSQDCDLEQGSKIFNLIKSPEQEISFNQFLHSVLYVPAFPAQTLREGTHLNKLFNIRTMRLTSDLWKPIVNNENPRYHYLPPFIDMQIPELMIDFKAYYSLSFHYFHQIYGDYYFASLNELFRENLSQRFANYLNRVGLPELK